MRAAQLAKPWQPCDSVMLAHQAELSLLNGDLDHFDESGNHDLSLEAKESVPLLPLDMVCKRLFTPAGNGAELPATGLAHEGCPTAKALATM